MAMLKLNRTFIYLSILLAAFFVLTYLAYWRINALLAPVASDGIYQVKEIHIPLNSSTAKIAAILEEEGLISNAYIFRLYARFKGYDKDLQAGNYLLATNMTMREILEELRAGVLWEEGIMFTIPEGFSVEQIAARLDNLGLVEEETFLELCSTYVGERFAFLNEVPEEVKYRLEGYLFPDTYEVHPGADAREIVEMMLERFQSVFSKELRQRAREIGLSIHQVVTIASIVEKEARVEEERPLISAVFHNRLNSQEYPLLQSCATVQYALGEVKPYLTNRDLEVDSPYNTYLYPHLPPGPIASPGLDSLRAALYPADVDYLFFVYKEDGTGTHYFSRTLEEHNYHKNLARQNRRSR